MIILLIVIILVIAVAAKLVWKMLDEDARDELERDSPVLTEMDKEAETDRASGRVKKTAEGPSEDPAKRDSGLAYGRGLAKETKKQTEEKTEEKEWESVNIYSYYGKRNIWRCVYCDGENLLSRTVCRVCGKEKSE